MLFGNNSSQSFGLFNNNKNSQTNPFNGINSSQSTGLFNNNKNSQNNTFNTLFNPFNDNNFQTNNIGDFEEKNRTNKKMNKTFIKCNHINQFCAFCPKEEIGLICYKCIYKYNIENNNCIPIEKNFDYYKNIYKNQLNIIKDKIKNKFNEFLLEIEKLSDNLENIQSLIEKIDLNFVLPIEVSFEERLEIGINKTISKMVNNLIKDQKSTFYLNLYETKLKNLKFNNLYPYKEENILIESQIPFIMKGIGIPKLSKENKENINIVLTRKKKVGLFSTNEPEINIPAEIKETEENKNLTIGILKESVNIQPNEEYSIKISGLNSCTYIDNEEEYNLNNKILIQSNNDKSILACLILE